MNNHYFRKITLLITIFLLCSCSSVKRSSDSYSRSSQKSSSSSKYSFVDPNKVVLEPYEYRTKEQVAYLLSDYQSIAEFAVPEIDQSAPRGLDFEIPSDGYFEIATYSDFTDSMVYEAKEGIFTFFNPYLDTTYYHRFYQNQEEKETAVVSSFKTPSFGIRNLLVEGVKNVRDMGNQLTNSGKKTKQGLLYRGGRLNESSVEEYNAEITEEGKRVFINEMKIKTEIDLRKVENNEIGSVDYEIGNVEGIKYVSIPMDGASGDFMLGNKEGIAEVFHMLANIDNYPIYFHCSIGTDRTGVVAYLLSTLLGEAKEDRCKDYLFSNFSDLKMLRTYSWIKKYDTNLAKYSKDENEAIELFLNEIGVSDDELTKIRNILLEF